MVHRCCVVGCNSSSHERKGGKIENGLSFYSFPSWRQHHGDQVSDITKRRRLAWVAAVRRPKITFHSIPTSMRVCSLHFHSGKPANEMYTSHSDWAPSLHLGHTNEKVSRYDRPKARKQRRTESMAAMDETALVIPDEAADVIQDVEARPEWAAFSQYCASDAQIRFYTKFPSGRVFKVFWEHVAPSASRLVYWCKARRIGAEAFAAVGPNPSHGMPLLSEFLIYSMRVAVGMKEQVIADMFQTSAATVNQLTTTWAHYLFFVLGTPSLWVSRDKIRSVAPDEVKKHCPNLRVILHSAEIAVAAPTSTAHALQSHTVSPDKNRTTLKAIVGFTPHGSVSFLSKLCAGSLSDKEVTRCSGILQLLEPGDEVMADKGFAIHHLLSDVEAKLIIPPSKHSARFTQQETQAITQLRMVARRAMARIKSNHIWDSPIPLTLVLSVSQIWCNCCLMSNFQGPLSC
ncbi:uncharacterized protein LOC134464447 [Engraulis encrasicolus]|uniref:uncharacterized protein LOC134464447 n=1 Tax=Engraulis encrasicolus TaxID=184585 RepID=UPI002FD58FCE